MDEVGKMGKIIRALTNGQSVETARSIAGLKSIAQAHRARILRALIAAGVIDGGTSAFAKLSKEEQDLLIAKVGTRFALIRKLAQHLTQSTMGKLSPALLVLLQNTAGDAHLAMLLASEEFQSPQRYL